MTDDWVPLDEKELLREDQGYYDNTSPQEHQAPRTAGGGFLDSGGTSPAGGAATAPAAAQRPSGKEITRDIILRALEKQGTKRRPHATADDPYAEDKWLAAQSHLHLNGCHIGRIANLRSLTTLEVLYLYDNAISVIENVAPLRRLTHLYLANNAIREITGLAGMPNLQKLYIEKNCLQTVSGLESCPSLEELHVSQQRRPPGTALTFERASMTALSASLRVLTASDCGITSASMGQLRGLSRLRRLDLSHNAIDSFEALDPVVQPCAVLQSLDLRGNPLCRQPKYRDTIILMNDGVTTVDDEQVSAQQREFLLRLHIRRMKAQLAAELKQEAAAAAEGDAGGGGGGPHGASAGPSLSGGSGPGSMAAGPYGGGGGGGAAGGHQHDAGFGGAHGVAGAAHRLPPRTGGFAAGAGGAGPGGGGGSGGPGSRGLSRNASGSGSRAAGRVAVHEVTLGMDGMGLTR